MMYSSPPNTLSTGYLLGKVLGVWEKRLLVYSERDIGIKYIRKCRHPDARGDMIRQSVREKCLQRRLFYFVLFGPKPQSAR